MEGRETEAQQLMAELEANIEKLKKENRQHVPIEKAYMFLNNQDKQPLDPTEVLRLAEQARTFGAAGEADYIIMELMQLEKHPDWPKAKLCQKYEEHTDRECSHTLMCNLASSADAPGALFYRGFCLFSGLGVKRREKEGYRLLREAAKDGHPKALVYLGELLLADEKVDEAAIHLERAADLGIKEGQNIFIRLCLAYPGKKLERLEHLNSFIAGTVTKYTNTERINLCRAGILLLKKTHAQVKEIAGTKESAQHYKNSLVTWHSVVEYLKINGKVYLSAAEYEDHSELIAAASGTAIKLREQLPNTTFTIFQLPAPTLPPKKIYRRGVIGILEDHELGDIAHQIQVGDFADIAGQHLAEAGHVLRYQADREPDVESYTQVMEAAINCYVTLVTINKDDDGHIPLIDCFMARALYYKNKGIESLARMQGVQAVAHIMEAKKRSLHSGNSRLGGLASAREASLFVNDLHPEVDSLPPCGQSGCKHFKASEQVEPFAKEGSTFVPEAAYVCAELNRIKDDPSCLFTISPVKAKAILERCPLDDLAAQTSLAEILLDNVKGTEADKQKGMALLHVAAPRFNRAKNLLIQYELADTEAVKTTMEFDQMAQLLQRWHELDQEKFELDLRKRMCTCIKKEGIPQHFLFLFARKGADLLHSGCEDQEAVLQSMETLQQFITILGSGMTEDEFEAIIAQVTGIRMFSITNETILNKTRLVLDTLCHTQIIDSFNVLKQQVKAKQAIKLDPIRPTGHHLLEKALKQKPTASADLQTIIYYAFKLLRSEDPYEKRLEEAAIKLADIKNKVEQSGTTSDYQNFMALQALFENTYFQRLNQVIKCDINKLGQCIPIGKLIILGKSAQALPGEAPRQDAYKRISIFVTNAFEITQKAYQSGPLPLQNFLALRELGLMALILSRT
jgi:hypothetical protein